MNDQIVVEVGDSLEELSHEALDLAHGELVIFEQGPEVVLHVFQQQKCRLALAVLRAPFGADHAVALDHIDMVQRAQ